MLRTVEIRNLTGNPIVDFPNHVIPAHGRLILPIAEYIQIATEYDVSSLPVRVTFPDVELRKVSVREFGAIGDGVSDDTYAIQRAIDSVALYGGGVVTVPVGVYLNRGIILHGNVSLQGDSMVASVLKQAENSGTAAISISGGSCMISDLYVKGAIEQTPIVKTSLIDGFETPIVRDDVAWNNDTIYATWEPDGTWYKYSSGSIEKTRDGVKFTYADSASGIVMPLAYAQAVNVGNTVTLKFTYRCSETFVDDTNNNIIYLLNNPTPNSTQKLDVSLDGRNVWRTFEHTWTVIKGEGANDVFEAVLVGWWNPGAGNWLEIKDGSAILTKGA